MIFFLLCLLADDRLEITRFEGTGVFQPLQPWEAVVSPRGHVYVLNFNEATINHYDARGKRLANIGSKGRGPGEFTYAFGLFFLEGKLFVYDKLDGQISEYNEDGAFLKRFATNSRGLSLVKVKGGWIYGDWADFFNQGNASLFWATPDFSESRLLMELEDKGTSKGLMVMRSDGKAKARFSPLSNLPILVARADGGMAYMTHPHDFRIYRIDPTGEVTTIDRDEKRIPFDADWADELLAEKTKERQNLPKVEKAYPDYFPTIRGLMLDPDGNLAVDRWRGRPGDRHHPITLDPDGAETSQTYGWETLERIAGVIRDDLVLTTYDPETEEAGLARVPVGQVKRFIEENPILFEGEITHSFSISL